MSCKSAVELQNVRPFFDTIASIANASIVNASIAKKDPQAAKGLVINFLKGIDNSDVSPSFKARIVEIVEKESGEALDSSLREVFTKLHTAADSIHENTLPSSPSFAMAGYSPPTLASFHSDPSLHSSMGDVSSSALLPSSMSEASVLTKSQFSLENDASSIPKQSLKETASSSSLGLSAEECSEDDDDEDSINEPADDRVFLVESWGRTLVPSPKKPFVSILEARAMSLAANEARMITIPHQGRANFSHVRIPLQKLSSSSTCPDFVGAILNGHADKLLTNKEKGNWGKGDLEHLGECACDDLSRIKRAHYRREFDNAFSANACHKIFQPDVKQFTVTHLATGFLFSTFVQAVQLLSQLKKKEWKGKIVWNVIDSSYLNSMLAGFESTLDFERFPESEDVLISKAVMCFRDQLSRVIPEGIDFEWNIFSSHDGYVAASCKDSLLQFDFLVGMDIFMASEIWEQRELTPAGKKGGLEFLLEYRDFGATPNCTVGGVDFKETVFYELAGDEPCPADEPLEKKDNKGSSSEKTEGKDNKVA